MLLGRVKPAEMIKFAFNHKARFCYLAMTLWIFVLVTVMYLYVSVKDETVPMNPVQIPQKSLSLLNLRYNNLHTIMCKPPVRITRGSEAAVNTYTWRLQGVLVLTRHGDRGPLTHIRDGDKIHCDVTPQSDLLKRYEEFLHNVSGGAQRGPWAAAPGPFHNFPSLPVKAGATRCPIAQMTSLGVLQMLTVGSILKEAYSEALRLDADNLSLKHGSEDIIVWSTRYRRTYQSLLAVVWAASGGGSSALWRVLPQCRESHSVSYCFNHCTCAATNTLSRKLDAESKQRLESQPTIKKLIVNITRAIYENKEKADPEVLKDAILAYICHDAPLPCTHKIKQPHNTVQRQDLPLNPHLRKLHSFIHKRKRLIDSLNSDIDYERSNLDLNNEFGRKAKDIINMVYDSNKKEPVDFDVAMEKEKLVYYQQKYLDNDDDDDGNKKDYDIFSSQMYDQELHYPKPIDALCVKKDHVLTLFSYLDWGLSKAIKSKNSKRKGILTAYGLIQNMVQNMIRMISENKPKFVLYSGHDTTMHALLLSLGIRDIDNAVHYASRIIFEVYRVKELRNHFTFAKRSAVAQDFFFRVVYNGLDVTDKLEFCKQEDIVVMTVGYGLHQLETYLCPIENMVRFLHDDYFSIFNASNFKDACLSYKHAKLKF